MTCVLRHAALQLPRSGAVQRAHNMAASRAAIRQRRSPWRRASGSKGRELRKRQRAQTRGEQISNA